MDQLDTLSVRLGTMGLNLILTQIADVTFLPGFKSVGISARIRTGSWKRGIEVPQGGREWSCGPFNLFDINAFSIDRIRDW